jgi:hypothetical protein
MVGHQRVGVQRATGPRKRLAEPVQVAEVIFLGEEAGLVLVAALYGVQRCTFEVGARAAGLATLYRRAGSKSGLDPLPLISPRPSSAVVVVRRADGGVFGG